MGILWQSLETSIGQRTEIPVRSQQAGRPTHSHAKWTLPQVRFQMTTALLAALSQLMTEPELKPFS